MQRMTPRTHEGVPPRRWTVVSVMTTDPLVLSADQPVRAAARMLFDQRVGGAPVVDDDGQLIGVVSERDLLEKEAAFHLSWRGAGEAQRRRTARTVGQICTRPARTTTPEETLRRVARRFIDERVARLVVVEDGRVVGIITRHDVLRAMLREDDELREDVSAAMRHADLDDVTATVNDGVVTLSGQLDRRTQYNTALDAVETVDGVVDVHPRLTWRIDDILPRLSHPR